MSSLLLDEKDVLYNKLNEIINGLDISNIVKSYDSYFFAKTSLLNDPSGEELSQEKLADQIYNLEQENINLKKILKQIEDLVSSTTNSLISIGFGLAGLSIPFIEAGREDIQDATKIKSEQDTLPQYPEGYVPTVSDVISLGESAGDYNVTFGVNKYESPEDFSGGRKLTEMSLAEVMQFQKKRNNTVENTGAMGKYQFIPSTLSYLVEKSNLDINNTKFSPQVQEQLQSLLIKENIKGLEEKNIPTTPTNLSLAHYVGVGGVSAVQNAIADGKGDLTVAQAIKEYTGKDVSPQNKELTRITAKEFEKNQREKLKINAKKTGMNISPGFFEKEIKLEDLEPPSPTPSEVETQNLLRGNKGVNLNQSSQSYNQAEEENNRPLVVMNERVVNSNQQSPVMNKGTSAGNSKMKKPADATQREYSSYFAVV